MDFSTITYSLFILTGLFGFVVLLLMAFSYKSNKLVNFFLFAVFTISSIRLLIMGTYGLNIQTGLKDFSGAYRIIPLFNVSLLFLYFKSIVEDQRQFKFDFLAHLILPAFYFSFLVWYNGSAYYGMFAFKLLNLTITFSFIFVYLLKSLKVLNNSVWKNTFSLHSEHFKLMRNWTIFLFSVAVLLYARIIISFISDLIYGEIITGNDFNILHAIIWMTVFVKVLVSPEILFGLPHLKKKVHAHPEIKIKLDENWYFEKITIHNQQDLKLKSKIDDRLLALIEEIETLIRDHNYFRNQKITISDVANELNIPVSHLVYLFKYHSKMTFTEYKTFHKIEDAKLLIEGGFLARNTLESLAAEVGFASYNPFFTAFKKLTAVSPNDYSLRFQQQSLGNGSKEINLSVVGSKSAG
jgi:AraC-like DNA-binding protein